MPITTRCRVAGRRSACSSSNALAEEANRGAQSRGQLPVVEQGIRQARSQLRRLERELERRGCYEQFLFTRSLRRTRRCVGLDRNARTQSRQLKDLTIRRQQMLGGGDKSYQDDIIRELARNNCGGVYSREARRRNPFSNFWQDEDSGDRGGFRGNTFAGLPFATYRTVCVRLCDGYYFPVSFSTLPTHFGRDANACQSQCAAPTALYFHQNPGQSVDQMVSHREQLPYAELKTAFRYRKEYVAGCSCKQAEFIPTDGRSSPQKAAAPAGAAPGAGSAGARQPGPRCAVSGSLNPALCLPCGTALQSSLRHEGLREQCGSSLRLRTSDALLYEYPEPSFRRCPGGARLYSSSSSLQDRYDEPEISNLAIGSFVRLVLTRNIELHT